MTAQALMGSANRGRGFGARSGASQNSNQPQKRTDGFDARPPLPVVCKAAAQEKHLPVVCKAAAQEKANTARKVPGAEASTVEATSFWNSLLRWILGGPSSRLRYFLHASLKTQADRDEVRPCTSRPVWPMPLPFHGKQLHTNKKEVDALRRAVNVMVLVLNWLQLGSPAKCPREYHAGETLSAEQHSIVARLTRLCDAWTKSGPISAADMGELQVKSRAWSIM